jgi:AcrR family transcriptional regulator
MDDPDAATAVAPKRERRDTRLELLTAAETCLRRDGHADLSTRRVAETAGVPLSQIHYHFGSKLGLVLALLDHLNDRLLERQAATFSEPMPLWRRWERACDFLDEDLASGYVRILQDMTAAGWSDPEIAAAVRRDLQGWYTLLTGLAREAGERFGGLGPFSPQEVASLVGAAFLGSESMLLLGFESEDVPVRQALRRFGGLIREVEESDARHHA